MYPDLADVLAGSVQEALLSRELEAQESLYVQAIAAIERHCHQSFEAEGDDSGGPVSRAHDGTGTRMVYTDRRLSSLETISMDGTDLDPETITIAPRRNRVSFSTTSFGSWASQAVAEMELGGQPRMFNPGQDNIVITGVWGWTDAEYPSIVTEAIRATMEDFAAIEASPLSESIGAARMQGLGSITQGGLSVDLTQRELDLSRRVKRMLAGNWGEEPLVFPMGAGALV